MKSLFKVILLIGLLIGCANHDTPKFGKQVEAPYGWEYTYCPSHPNEIGCKELNK
jgi:hypothetical protein